MSQSIFKKRVKVDGNKPQFRAGAVIAKTAAATGVTVIHLIEDASLIEDTPNLQPQFPCKELQVMKRGKLPNRRRTPLLEYFMSSF